MTEQQKKALDMLWNGAKVQDTASALGVHRCTIWRWEKQKDFQREWKRRYKAAEAEMRKAAKRQIRGMLKKRDAKLNMLQSNLDKASARLLLRDVKSSDDPAFKAFNRAYNAWSKELFRGLELPK